MSCRFRRIINIIDAFPNSACRRVLFLLYRGLFTSVPVLSSNAFRACRRGGEYHTIEINQIKPPPSLSRDHHVRTSAWFTCSFWTLHTVCYVSQKFWHVFDTFFFLHVTFSHYSFIFLFIVNVFFYLLHFSCVHFSHVEWDVILLCY